MSDQSPPKGSVSQYSGRQIKQTRRQRHSEGNYSDGELASPVVARIKRERQPARLSKGVSSPTIMNGTGMSGKSLYEASTPTRSRFERKRKRAVTSSPLKFNVTKKQEKSFDEPSAPMRLPLERKWANGDLEMDAVTGDDVRPLKRHCLGLRENPTAEEDRFWETGPEASMPPKSTLRHPTRSEVRNPLWQPPDKSKRYQNWFGTPPKLLDWHMPGLLYPLQGINLAPISNPLIPVRLTTPNRTPFVRRYNHFVSAKVRSVVASTWNPPEPEQTFEYLPVPTDLASSIHTSHTKIGMFGSREEHIELTDEHLSEHNCTWGLFYWNRDLKDARVESISSSRITLEKEHEAPLTFERPEESFTDFNLLSTDIQFDNCCAMSDSDSDSQWSTDGWKMAAMLRGDTGFEVDNRPEVQYTNTLWTLPRATISGPKSSDYENDAQNGKPSSTFLRAHKSMIKSALKDVSMSDEDDNEVSRGEELEGQFVRSASEEFWSVFMEVNHDGESTSIEEEPDWDLEFLDQHETGEIGGDITDWAWS